LALTRPDPGPRGFGDSRGFYRIKPRTSLAPGEYGFVSTWDGRPSGSSVYDFGVD